MQGREPTFGDGRYLIRRELGRGTMGVVYEAEDSVLARTVAVKTIDLAFAAGVDAGDEFERRFFTEARVAARLSHPGIVVCHDVGKDPASGKLFIVFECLKGRTLADRAAEGPMDWRGALEVVVQVARAIHHAHEHGVVHRDLKPANIMLLEAATTGASGARAKAAVKIMDFGVARLESLGGRLTRTGQSFGSPLYMAPEQALGEASSARSDIFSVGSILCTLLLGRPWFDAGSLPAIVRRVVHDDAPQLSVVRPGLPASLDAVVAMALAKRQDDRYASAADMADDLEDVLAGKTAKHAAAAVSSPGRVSALAQDAPLDPLASLLEESPVPAAASLPAGAAADPAAQTTPMGVPIPVTAGSRRRWLVPAIVMLVLAALAAGALVSSRRPSRLDPAPLPSGPLVSDASPSAVAEEAPVPPAPTASTTPVPNARDHRSEGARDHGSDGTRDHRSDGSPACGPRRAAERGGGDGQSDHRVTFDRRVRWGRAGRRRDATGQCRAEPHPLGRGASIRERPPDRLDRRCARLRDQAPGDGFQKDRRLQGPRGPRRKVARRRTGPARGAGRGDVGSGPQREHKAWSTSPRPRPACSRSVWAA